MKSTIKRAENFTEKLNQSPDYNEKIKEGIQHIKENYEIL